MPRCHWGYSDDRSHCCNGCPLACVIALFSSERSVHSLVLSLHHDLYVIYVILYHFVGIQTFHCDSPRKLAFSKMDPSCAIGFYCRTQSDVDQLLEEIPKVGQVFLSDSILYLFQVYSHRNSSINDVLCKFANFTYF